MRIPVLLQVLSKDSAFRALPLLPTRLQWRKVEPLTPSSFRLTRRIMLATRSHLYVLVSLSISRNHSPQTSVKDFHSSRQSVSGRTCCKLAFRGGSTRRWFIRSSCLTKSTLEKSARLDQS